MGTQRNTIQRGRFWDQEGAWGHGGEALDTDPVPFKEITFWNFSNEVSHFWRLHFLLFEMGGRELAFLSCKT